jgi:alpha-glucosidase
MPGVMVVLNLGSQAMMVDLPASVSFDVLDGHGFHGTATNGHVSLPAYGAWFGLQR